MERWRHHWSQHGDELHLPHRKGLRARGQRAGEPEHSRLERSDHQFRLWKPGLRFSYERDGLCRKWTRAQESC